ncbi:MAG: PepSY domain-containing protein [Gammaproteobacteria bacterium]|nr:PepSY domain-containing protein [Gammaproteobacteria bacterium]
MRLLILLHRYLGIGIGLLIVLWCLSGFVMMYVQYPSESHAEQLLTLDRLDWDDCCLLPGHWAGDMFLDAAEVESLLGKPTLRLTRPGGGFLLADLSAGRVLGGMTEASAQAVAESYAARAEESFRSLGQLERDQWTVQSGYDPHRPLYFFALNDGAATEWYVSSTTGQVVLETGGRERFWNWLGSVVHWLYPTELRRHVGAWSQVVIWTSLVGVFLTLTGIYIGITRYRFGSDQRGSPYRGWFLWHHYLGLVFGILSLTWVVSGLLSMNPFGVLQGRSFSDEQNNVAGHRLTYEDVAAALDSLDPDVLPDNTVRLSASTFAGEFAWMAWTARGGVQRVGQGGPLDSGKLTDHAPAIRPEATIDSMGSLEAADAYYYGHHESRTFPVFRIIYTDGDRLYLDESSGQLLQAIDGNRRWSRWLFHGLHRGDFAAWARQRPLWDFFMLLLLAGVTVGSITGVYLGYQRVTGRE